MKNFLSKGGRKMKNFLSFIKSLFAKPGYINLGIAKQLNDRGIQPLFHSQINIGGNIKNE